MSIQVVRYLHQYERIESANKFTTLLFDPRLERGVERVVGDRYRRLELSARTADLVVVRGSDPNLYAQVDSDRMFRDLADGRTVMTLAPEQKGSGLVLRHADWSRDPEFDLPPIGKLCEAELLCGLHYEGAIFRHEGCHYLLPNSGVHAAAFVRMADALQDYVDVLRLCDYLIERVEPGTALAADNGSLLGLLSTLALKVSETKGFVPQIRALNEYPVEPTAVGRMADELAAGGADRLLFCLSVNSSGRVAEQLAGLSTLPADVVVLCNAGTLPEMDNIEAFSRHEVDTWEAKEHGRCDECPRLHLLTIDPHNYEVRARVHLKPAPLEIHQADEARPFWEAAQDADAVRLHVQAETAPGSSTPVRHLAVQIDVGKMLEKHDEFRQRCLAKLRVLSPPQLVVIPKHGCSEVLKQLVLEAYENLDPDDVLIGGVGDQAPELDGRLDQDIHVLVVDDALVSGATLVSLHRHIHSVRQDDGEAAISIFVPLSRPSSPGDHKHVARHVFPPERQGDGLIKGGLHFAYDLLLPDATECPWCREKEFLEERLDDLSAENRQMANARIDRLRKLEPPLLPCGKAEEPKTRGSFFGTLEPRAAFAAVSAYAQQMRCKMDEDRHDETIKIVDVPLLLQAFFDPIIVAAMLRTFQVRDLRDPGAAPEVARTISENIKGYEPATIAELALAATEGKLPAATVRQLLRERGEDWTGLYLELLEGY